MKKNRFFIAIYNFIDLELFARKQTAKIPFCFYMSICYSGIIAASISLRFRLKPKFTR